MEADTLKNRVYAKICCAFKFALSKTTCMRNFTCCFKFTVSQSDETLLSSLIDPVTSKPRMRTKITKEYDCCDIRVYAIWPFYGRFDGSPDSGAIASTVEFTSSTQGTAGAPTVDFSDGR